MENGTYKDNINWHLECRFYVCLVFGFVLLVMGYLAPPLGAISNGVLVGAGMMLILGGLSVGLDIKGIIYELRKLKEIEFDTKQAKENQ